MSVDERVQIAIENWAPRFIANGIDHNDYQRLAKSIERWEDWSPQWSACAAVHERMGEEANAQRNYVSAGFHYFQAAMTYHFGKFVFVQNPLALRDAHDHVVQNYRKALPYFDFPGERVAIPYEQGGTMYGILRKPWHTPTPPVVILVPGLDSVKEELHNYGDDFLRRGMAVLAIDGPGQGEMEFEYPLRYDFEVPVRFVIDYLEHRPDVDTSRVGLMGVSLGGYFAPRAAAFEPRLKAVIANCGAYNFAENFERLPLLTREAFTYRTKSKNESEARMKLEAFNLKGVMEKIRSPLLVIMGRLDRLIPPVAAEKMAAEAGGVAELWMFEDGNHVCNNIPYKHRPQQSDWMRQKLDA
jgi:dienelactone hydrolase